MRFQHLDVCYVCAGIIGVMGIKMKHFLSHFMAFLIGGVLFGGVSFTVTSYFFGKHIARSDFYSQIDSWEKRLRTIKQIKAGKSNETILELERDIYDLEASIESCPEYSCGELKTLYEKKMLDLQKYEFTEYKP